MVKKLLTPTEVTEESLDFSMIKEVGIGGEYLTQPKTAKLCKKEFFMPRLLNRESYASWESSGKKRIDERASLYLSKRLSQYTKPAIDEGVEQALAEFVHQRKSQSIDDR